MKTENTQLAQEETSFHWWPDQCENGRMEPQICTKMLKKLSENLGEKFPATTPGCSIVKIARLDYAFLEVFNRKQAQ